MKMTVQLNRNVINIIVNLSLNNRFSSIVRDAVKNTTV